MATEGRSQVAHWSTLPDGPCEQIAILLPRIARLACRFVCRSWRSSFTHALTPLSLDTRLFAAQTADDTRQGVAIGEGDTSTITSSATPGPLDPTWNSLINAIGPLLPSFTVRVSLRHESKARAAPDSAALTACLRYLASLPSYSQERLQLLLPLRYAIPDAALHVLSRDLTHLRRLRLVRCSLTHQLAVNLSAMTQLRHMCIAHANLAALPQLLAAATQLQHLHVHGYHSLVIVEDNAHQQATWRAAVELVKRSHASHPHQPYGVAGDRVGPSSDRAVGGTSERGRGRLQCLAISAHHLNHDTVLDEAELAFEAEALRWQIRYHGPECGQRLANASHSSGGGGAGGSHNGCNECSGGGAGGLGWDGMRCKATTSLTRTWQGSSSTASKKPSTVPGATGDGVQGRHSTCHGCWIDPHEDPSGPSMYGSTAPKPSSVPGGPGLYMGGGSGGANLCAAALVGLICDCCCGVKPAPWGGGHEDLLHCDWHGGGAGVFNRGEAERGTLRNPRPLDEVIEAVRQRTAPAPAGPFQSRRIGAVGSNDRHSEVNVAAAVAIADMAGRPSELAAGEIGALTLLKSGQREVRLYPRVQLAQQVWQPRWRDLQYVQLKLTSSEEPQPPALPPPLASGVQTDMTDGWVSLEALNIRPTCTGVWLDPDEWDGEVMAEVGNRYQLLEPVCRQEATDDAGREGKGNEREKAIASQGRTAVEAGGRLHASSNDNGSSPGGSGFCATAATPTAATTHWGRVGDVWVRLYDPPSPTAAHTAVQDAASHVTLLTACCHLTSLALGGRRTPFLGIGDDTMGQLAANLTSLTKLHLAAGYTLPLGDVADDDAENAVVVWPAASLPSSSIAAPMVSPPTTTTATTTAYGDGGQWLQLPARLTPLGGLLCLQRLGLHFGNPLRRPAVVSHGALPTSLTSLSLHGVVLLPDAAITAVANINTVRAGRAATPPPPPPLVSTSTGPDLLPCPLAAAATAVASRGLENSRPAAGAAVRTPLNVTPVPARAPPGTPMRSPSSCGPVQEGRLRRLRELSLTSSYIARADLLGCGPCLWMLSLRRNSGLNAAPPECQDASTGVLRNGEGVEAGGGGGCGPPDEGCCLALVALLRKWWGLQTLRVVGCTGAAADMQLPGEEYCLNWQSAAGLSAILSCLPGLRMLQISIPEAAPHNSGHTGVPAPQDEFNTTAAATTAATAAAFTAATAAAAMSTPPAIAAACLLSVGNRPDVCPHPPPQHLRAPQAPLPRWNLITLPDMPPLHSTPSTSIAATTSVATTIIMAATTSIPAATSTSTNPTNRTVAVTGTPVNTTATPATTTTNNNYTNTTTNTINTSTINATNTFPPGPTIPPPWLEDSNPSTTHRSTTSWLATLMTLLARQPPHLTSLRVSCTVNDRAAAEHAVRLATAVLPHRLPCLEQLEIILDVALLDILAQPESEQYAREWAGWLRCEEQVLQGRMRHTCVSLTPQPNLVSRVSREAARAAAQQTGFVRNP